jgi:hypothetical protein
MVMIRVKRGLERKLRSSYILEAELEEPKIIRSWYIANKKMIITSPQGLADTRKILIFHRTYRRFLTREVSRWLFP